MLKLDKEQIHKEWTETRRKMNGISNYIIVNDDLSNLDISHLQSMELLLRSYCDMLSTLVEIQLIENGNIKEKQTNE